MGVDEIDRPGPRTHPGRDGGKIILKVGDGGDYAGMFACVIAISMVGFAADRLSIVAIRRLLRWRE